MLLTIDIRRVYDEFVEGFTMRIKVWAAVFLFGMGVVAVAAPIPSEAQSSAQSQGQNQGQPMSGTATTPVGGMAADHAQGGSMDTGKPAVPAGPLKITFEAKSSEWTPATLASLPHKTVTVYNEHAKVNQTYSGVDLIDLLKPLGVPEKPHGKDFRLYLVAEGSDGYQVVYSVGEVTPDVHDATVMVADSLDGKPITASGPLQLVATGEKRPARWVRNLVAIRVQTAE
jgi:Oxidoreductase molybdopterin binding domain